jgi:DNA invertase Pin-like site-specific DNA recombinase
MRSMPVARQQTQAEQQPARAYSYVRFSSPEQAKGDSFDRQTRQTKAYCERRGLVLDTELTFRDLGVSAFHGRNAEKQLGAFLDAVRTGVIAKGSYLIVESLDRISRQTVRKAVRIMEEIVEAGINLVDLSDGDRVYNAHILDTDPTAFLFMAIRFMRANEESALKSRRVAASYERKRKDALEGKLFTKALPAWLRWNDNTGKHELIPERAKVLRGIFDKADAGWSKHRIARWLNTRGVETWGTGKRKAAYWHSSYIQKLLANPAVIGTFTPHRALKESGGLRKRVALDPINGYFPAAISAAVFDRVSAQAKSRAARGRNADAEPRSIFAGVLRCAHCGDTVTRVSKGEYVYLVCSRANQRAKGCRYVTVPYAEAEAEFRRSASSIIGDAPRGYDTAELEAEVEGQDVLVGELMDECQHLLNLTISDKSEAARQRLQAAETELRTERERLRELRAQRETRTSANVLRRLEAVRVALERKPINVTEANRALRQAVSRIVLDPEQVTLTIFWLHAEQRPQEVQLYTRRGAAAVFGPPGAPDHGGVSLSKRKDGN